MHLRHFIFYFFWKCKQWAQDALGTRKSRWYKGRDSKGLWPTKAHHKTSTKTTAPIKEQNQRKRPKKTHTPSPLPLDLFNVHQTATSPLSLYWNGTFRSNTSLYSPQLHLPTSPSWLMEICPLFIILRTSTHYHRNESSSVMQPLQPQPKFCVFAAHLSVYQWRSCSFFIFAENPNPEWFYLT